MDVLVSQEVLSQQLNTAKQVAGNMVGGMPILGNVLLKTTPDGLQVSATNLEVGFSMTVPASNISDGGITVPARLFADIVRSLPKGNDVGLATDGDVLSVRCGRYSANLNGLPIDEFPMEDFSHVTPVANVNGSDLKKAIVATALAVAADESRPILTGIQCVFVGGDIRFTATDGYRMIRTRVSAELFTNGEEALLPAKSLLKFVHVLRADDVVEIGKVVNRYIFRVSDTVFHCASLSGDFPNIDTVVPSGTPSAVAVADTNILRQSVRIAALFAKDSSANALKLTITPDNVLHIESAGAEIGDNVNTVDALVTGEPVATQTPVSIGVNAKFLLDALTGVDTPQVVLNYRSPQHPLTVKPSGQGDNLFAVVMPMILQ